MIVQIDTIQEVKIIKEKKSEALRDFSFIPNFNFNVGGL